MNIWLYAFLLIILGFISIFVEFFLIPGFTVFGFIGLVLIGAGIYLVAANFSYVAVMALLSACIALFILMLRAFSRSGMPRRFVLNAKLEKKGHGVQVKAGDEGEALTPLRPAGTVLIRGIRLDALSEGDFIPAGSLIEVISATGAHLLVKEKSAL